MTSSVDEVCKWAGCAVTAGGAGLSDASVAILRREEIKGTNLFELTDQELKVIGMFLGARKDLLAAVALLREPKGARLVLFSQTGPPASQTHSPFGVCAASLQPAVPFLADVPWAYQESPEVISALREGLLLRYSAWAKRSTDVPYRADKRKHPVFTVYAGPGSGKSRLLSELPMLALAAVKDTPVLARLLNPSLAYVFHVGFENGTKFQISEKNGMAAVANRMMWQFMRPEGAVDGFAAFAARHTYCIDDALDKLSGLTQRARVDQPVFLLIDGIHNLSVREAHPTVFREAVDAISAAVCSSQFIIGVVAATSGLQLEELFGKSKQERVFLRPPLLSHPELVAPDDAAFPALYILRDDMGGHGRALEILATLVHGRKAGTGVQSISDLSSAVQSKLLKSYSDWMNVQPLEALLGAIISRRLFMSLSDLVVGDLTVDNVRELGLVQWRARGPLVAPVILLLMMKSNLSGRSLLTRLASGYNKLEFGSRSGNWWQDFEEFVAVFRAIKLKAFRGLGWVSMAQLHHGASLSTASQALFVRTLKLSRNVSLVHAATRCSSKTSGHVNSVVPWVSVLGKKKKGAPVDIAGGAVVVLNGTSAKAADVFLDVKVIDSSFADESRICREVIACRHREKDVSAVDFVKERAKAADCDDIFLFFTTAKIKCSLAETNIGTDPGPLSRKVRAAGSKASCLRDSLIRFSKCRESEQQWKFRRRLISLMISLDSSTLRALGSTLVSAAALSKQPGRNVPPQKYQRR